MLSGLELAEVASREAGRSCLSRISRGVGGGFEAIGAGLLASRHEGVTSVDLFLSEARLGRLVAAQEIVLSAAEGAARVAEGIGSGTGVELPRGRGGVERP